VQRRVNQFRSTRCKENALVKLTVTRL